MPSSYLHGLGMAGGYLMLLPEVFKDLVDVSLEQAKEADKL